MIFPRTSECPLCKKRLLMRHAGPLHLLLDDVVESAQNTQNTVGGGSGKNAQNAIVHEPRGENEDFIRESSIGDDDDNNQNDSAERIEIIPKESGDNLFEASSILQMPDKKNMDSTFDGSIVETSVGVSHSDNEVMNKPINQVNIGDQLSNNKAGTGNTVACESDEQTGSEIATVDVSIPERKKIDGDQSDDADANGLNNGNNAQKDDDEPNEQSDSKIATVDALIPKSNNYIQNEGDQSHGTDAGDSNNSNNGQNDDNEGFGVNKDGPINKEPDFLSDKLDDASILQMPNESSIGDGGDNNQNDSEERTKIVSIESGDKLASTVLQMPDDKAVNATFDENTGDTSVGVSDPDKADAQNDNATQIDNLANDSKLDEINASRQVEREPDEKVSDTVSIVGGSSDPPVGKKTDTDIVIVENKDKIGADGHVVIPDLSKTTGQKATATGNPQRSLEIKLNKIDTGKFL